MCCCVVGVLVCWLDALLVCWFTGVLVVVLASVVPISSIIWFWVKDQARSSDADLRRSTQLGECPLFLLRNSVSGLRPPMSQICPCRSTPQNVRRRCLRLRVQSCAAPPVGRPAVIRQADLGQRSLSKIYLGGPPLPPTQPISQSCFRSFFDLLLSLVI